MTENIIDNLEHRAAAAALSAAVPVKTVARYVVAQKKGKRITFQAFSTHNSAWVVLNAAVEKHERGVRSILFNVEVPKTISRKRQDIDQFIGKYIEERSSILFYIP